MPNSLEVANFFISKSLQEGVELTPMKLVKLVYIAHGWYLALNDGTPLLSEPVQAWKYGPVVPTVYHKVKGYGNRQITQLVYTGGNFYIDDPTLISFLNKIWEVYRGYSGLQLSTLTHQSGSPWEIVWNERAGSKQYETIMDNKLIRTHFASKIPDQQPN